MPTIAPGKLNTLLASPARSAVFFLHGEESYLRDAAERRIIDAYLDSATRDFNLDQLRGSDVAAEDLASIAATPPMMATHRIVVVRDAQGLGAKAREVVESIAASPPEGLVLIVSAQIPSGTKAKFYSTIQQRTQSLEFAAVDPLDLPVWLVEHSSEQHGLELELPAARALVSSVGGGLGILASELEKLAAYVHGRTRITLEDVKAVVGVIPRVDRWAWFDLVAEKRFSEALAMVPDLLDGETGVGVVIGIGSQLVRVGLAVAGGKEALDRELRAYQKWTAGRLLTTSREWTGEQVDAAIEELVRTDRLLKSAPLSDRQAIEELLLRIAARVGQRRRAA